MRLKVGKVHIRKEGQEPRTLCGADSGWCIVSEGKRKANCSNCLAIKILGRKERHRSVHTHFLPSLRAVRSKCGKSIDDVHVTGKVENVTCKLCIMRIKPNFEALEKR